MWYTVIVALAILGTSLVLAQDDTCSTRYGFDIDLPGSSCVDIYSKNPTSHGRSGYYVLKTDHLFFAYCDMDLDCGGIKGGWMRIADINTNRGDTCPSGWTNYKSYCTGGSAAGCYSAFFSTNSTSYTKMCGKILGYQKGSMDAFYPSAHSHGKYPDTYKPITASRSLDGVYVDGISITTGSPRKHVWTFAVGVSEDVRNYNPFNCPCAKYPGPDPPTYVGSHYYCESGITGAAFIIAKLYTNDSLWDGAGCISENSCCYDVGMPWFFRQFPTTTTGDIEVRICYDEGFSNEAVAVEQIQFYMQ